MKLLVINVTVSEKDSCTIFKLLVYLKWPSGDPSFAANLKYFLANVIFRPSYISNIIKIMPHQ